MAADRMSRSRVPVVLIPAARPGAARALFGTGLPGLQEICTQFVHRLVVGHLKSQNDVKEFRKYLDNLPQLLIEQLVLLAKKEKLYPSVLSDENPNSTSKLNVLLFQVYFNPAQSRELALYNLHDTSRVIQVVQYLLELHSELGLTELTLCSTTADTTVREYLILQPRSFVVSQLRSLLSYLPRLRSLHLLELADDDLLYELAHSPFALTLETLSIEDSTLLEGENVTDDGVTDFLEKLAQRAEEEQQSPRLQLLDLSRITSSRSLSLDSITAQSIVMINKHLPNLQELRLELRQFMFCKHALSTQATYHSDSVRRLHVRCKVSISPDVPDLISDMATHLPDLFPRLEQLSLDGLQCVSREHHSRLEHSLKQLPVQLVTSATLLDASETLLGMFPKLRQVFIVNVNHGFKFSSRHFEHLRRIVLEKEPFSLPFQVILNILEHCPRLLELLVRAPTIHGASDAALSEVFRDHPDLCRLEIFYLCSYESKIGLTTASVQLILDKCRRNLKKLGHIQTWTMDDQTREEYSAPGTSSGYPVHFRAVKAASAARMLPWKSSEKIDQDELSEFSRYFYP